MKTCLYDTKCLDELPAVYPSGKPISATRTQSQIWLTFVYMERGDVRENIFPTEFQPSGRFEPWKLFSRAPCFRFRETTSPLFDLTSHPHGQYVEVYGI